jgi:Cu(I)/Ag(I) efflux system membrane fusion protein/cobalt-zinc-cadmium efflux system membrane fusion protein
MKTGLRSLILVGVVALALGGGYLLGLRHDGHDHGKAVNDTEEKKGQYTCSMHPFILRDEPGSCPICGMALTPVKNGGSSAPIGDGITIDPITLQNMGVRTEPVIKRNLERSIRTVGVVAMADERQYAVNTKIEGWVEQLHVDQLGQRVSKGQPLLSIYSPQLVAAQQEYLLAAANRQRLAGSSFPEIVAGSARLLEAARTRLRYWDISPEQLKLLESTGKPSKTLTLYSEHSGIVTSKKVLQGARVMAGEELLQIADLSTLWVNADIYEYELPWVKVGQKVEVELPMLGRTITGTIDYLFPALDTATRTVKARIVIDNRELAVKPSMFANVRIVAQTAASVLTIPITALLNSGNEQTVFVALGEGRFAPRPVTTGLRDEALIEVRSGLGEGESVVVSAQFMLDSESRLREALDKMTAPKATSSTPPAKADSQPLDDLFK